MCRYKEIKCMSANKLLTYINYNKVETVIEDIGKTTIK